MFIELHVIQSLPPSNPNRGQDGGPKSINYGGTLRSRLSSQSQKRAARMWYRDRELFDREQMALRSKRWDSKLSELLTIGTVEQRPLIARVLLNLFNVGPGNLLKESVKGVANLLFLAEHEVCHLAANAAQHEDLLIDLAGRVAEYAAFVEADGGKDKKRSYDRHPTKKELAPLRRAITSGITEAIPGDVALFGRMMSVLTETSVDGCVQVADAISVNSFQRQKTQQGYVTGEIDWFSAVDDIAPADEPDKGAGMVGEAAIVTPVFYRYTNVCVHELERLMGDAELAQQCAAAYLKAFALGGLPSGHERSHAHHTAPEFVMVQTSPYQPYSHAPAFLNAINEQIGSRSISQQAVALLTARATEIHEVYGDDPAYAGVAGLQSHYTGALPLDTVLAEAIAATHSAPKTAETSAQ